MSSSFAWPGHHRDRQRPVGQLAHLGLRAPAANWRPWLALAAAHLIAHGDTLARDAALL